MNWLDIVHLIVLCVACFAGLVVLMMIGYVQTTWKMTPEEKARFDKFIEENGILGHDDWL